MMNISAGNASVSFAGGKLKLDYFNVTFDAGTYPDRLNGAVQVTPDDGLTIMSTEDEVAHAAKLKIQALVADDAPAGA
ncbi:hypothetical protein [Leuconostoc lactis]|nr:hypothetical protein [Leuconostoc lactis]